MRNVLFLIFLIPALSQSQQAQTRGFGFPQNLLIDPFDSGIRKLKPKRIVQYYTERKQLFVDSLSRGKAFTRPQYAIDFDSLSKPIRFRYDFRENGINDFIFGNDQITIKPVLDSSRIFPFVNDGDTVWYNFFENAYTYLHGIISKVTVFDPSFYRGVIDGVYVQEKIYQSTTIKNTVDNNGRLSKTQHYIEGKLYSTKTYHYSTFKHGSNKIELLTSVKETHSNGSRTTFLNYLFWD